MNHKQYREAWEKGKQGMLPDIPLNIDIELSTYCNMTCKMCPQSKIKKRNFMDIHLAKKIIIEAEKIGVPSIKLNWRGESTLHPQFREICEFIQTKKFKEVILNTNGSFDFTKYQTVNKTFSKIIFSLDSLKPNTFNKIRPGINLHFILSKLYLFNNEKVKINFTVQSENENEFAEMEKWCLENRYEFNPRLMFPRTGFDKLYVHNKRIILGRKNCGYPFQRLVISHEGKVYPCCVDWDEIYCVGNIRKQSMIDIWHGCEINNIRKDLSGAVKQNRLCKFCTSWLGYKWKDTTDDIDSVINTPWG